MFHVSLRMVTLLVCLLGFVGSGVACDEHENDQANSASNKLDMGSDKAITENVAEEFKNSLTEEKEPSEIASMGQKSENKSEEQQSLPQVANVDVKVIEFVLANKVEGREPKEVVETFNQENGKGFAFAQLSAEKHSQVAFVWFKEGREHSRFTTNVHASKRWRTYSSTKLRPGNWKVQLMAGDQVLAERTFTVQ